MKKILIALLAAAMLFAFTACDDDSSPAADWNIGARLAENTNEYDNHGNPDKVESVVYSDGTITISAPLTGENALASYDDHEGRGAGQWVSLLVSTGVNPITEVTYSSNSEPKAFTEEDITEAETMAGYAEGDKTGSPRQDDEFVLWIKADDVAENGKAFTLEREGVPGIIITVDVIDTAADAGTAETK